MNYFSTENGVIIALSQNANIRTNDNSYHWIFWRLHVDFVVVNLNDHAALKIDFS